MDTLLLLSGVDQAQIGGRCSQQTIGSDKNIATESIACCDRVGEWGSHGFVQIPVLYQSNFGTVGKG